MRSAILLITGLCLQTALVLAATGCSKPPIAIISAMDSLSHSFLALGDSYTIGESVGNTERFPAQTANMLRTMDIRMDSPQYIAQTGWTSEDLQNAVKKANLLSEYTVVSLLIGVNDQFQGLDTGAYRKRFTQLLEQAIRLTGNRANHVFVLSIPDYGVTPFGGGSKKVSKEIDDFNAINKAVTLSHDVAYIDITPTSRFAANDESFTANDGLHPSGKQYQLWARKLAEAIQPVLH
jgi:lysophospholipase L1-like esterase